MAASLGTMADGIHTEVEIGDPQPCQVARFGTGDDAVTSVRRTGLPDGEGAVHEEFTVGPAQRVTDGGGTRTDDVRTPDVSEVRTPEVSEVRTFDASEGNTLDGSGPAADDPASVAIEERFAYDDRTVYGMERSRQDCVCEQIEAAGCVVRDVAVVDGCLQVTFLASDIERLESVLGRLNLAYDDVYVRRLLRSEEAVEGADAVMVDRSLLTDRQREVLATAHGLGYFEHPRDTSATAVAEELEITTATFTEHLAAAQRKLLGELL